MSPMSVKTVAWGALLALRATLVDAVSVSGTILIFAQDEATSSAGTSGLRGYGIPYETVIVPEDGIELPELASGDEEGNYGGIVVLNEVGYDYDDGWRSAITEEQWDEIYEYQTSFGVRLVHLNVFPTSEYGVTTFNPSGLGCCDEGMEQSIRLTDTSGFPTANLKEDAPLNLEGLWHYPATVTDEEIATPFAEFGANEMFEEDTVAAVINNIDGREQMVWFTAWATEWSVVSNYLQHAYIHWMTRGLFVGHRKIYLNAQVDDIHLDTPMYWPDGEIFRTSVEDMENHKEWQVDINSRLPDGSAFFLEMCHNGNGDIIVATDTDEGWEICDPQDAVDYETPPDPPLEFMKPLGTGVDIWPNWFDIYPWELSCCVIDPLASWFMEPENRDVYAHVSHTFTHYGLNNATYNDTWREISFNRDWMVQIGVADAEMFSPFGLVPPAITGLHNGDAIRAWMDNGIQYVVGDNTRPLLRNQDDDFWPKISNVDENGHEGLVIVPRWASNIYYNCDVPECCVQQWIDVSGVDPETTFEDLMANEITVNTRYLLGLHPDPYMFHQANMRSTDMELVQVGDQTGEFSLIQMWVEAITQELSRLTDWPILSLKHDDIARLFLDRMTRDQCEPQITYTYSDDVSTITSVTISSIDDTCDAPIPVTFPPTASVSVDGGDVQVEQIGSEPVVLWVTLNGEPLSFSLAEPITL